MTCITEILKLKGNKDFFIPLDENGKPRKIAVEGGGTYKNYEYLITLNHHGSRCGYVAIPSNHPFNNCNKHINTYSKEEEIDYNDLDIDCHGGLTFGSSNHTLKKLLKQSCTDIWIGFDCGHSCDAYDQETFKKYYGQKEYDKSKSFFDSMKDIYQHELHIRDFSYVENQCKHIINQLIQKEKIE